MSEDKVSTIIHTARSMRRKHEEAEMALMAKFCRERFDQGYELGKEHGTELEKSRFHLSEIFFGALFGSALLITFLIFVGLTIGHHAP